MEARYESFTFSHEDYNESAKTCSPSDCWWIVWALLETITKNLSPGLFKLTIIQAVKQGHVLQKASG